MALPKPLLLGAEISRDSTTPNLLPQIWTTNTAVPPILIRRWARNGHCPDVHLASSMGEAMNQAGMLRTKNVFTALNTLNTSIPIAASGTSKARWRWAWHTSPLAHQIAVTVVMHPTSSTTAGDSSTTVQIDKAAGGGTKSDAFHVGASPSNAVEVVTGWQYRRIFTTYLAVDPDTDYVGLFTDGAGALLQSACVYEIASMTVNNNGYFPQNVPERAPILSTDRSRMMTLIRSLWKRGGSHVLNWYCQRSGDTPRTFLSATSINIVDGTSTTPNSSTPGYTLDMRYKDRLTQTSGVPCRIYVYADNSINDGVGHIKLKNSSGTTIATVTFASGATGWQSVDFSLPATLDKYDILGDTQGTGPVDFKVHAVSIFEYEA